MSKLRKTTFFNRKLRNVLADFAPTIAVFSGIAASVAATNRYGICLPKLNVPEVLQTTACRPWLVDIFSVSHKVKLLCVFPAIMATVLLFMDQNITVRLMMAKENKLKKGSGLHLDMLVIALVTTITSLLGMPWMVAATVRSLAHMRSLQNYGVPSDDKVNAENPADIASENPSIENASESTPAAVVMTGVQEQRVTGFMIHTLIGAAIIYCRKFLRQIPVSVLTGLFLYLGTSSIDKTDLFERAKLFITDDRDVPKSFPWAKNVALYKTKLFTAIQLALLASMWWIKGTALGVFFPVLIGLLAPVRIALEKLNVFSKTELDALDEDIAN